MSNTKKTKSFLRKRNFSSHETEGSLEIIAQQKFPLIIYIWDEEYGADVYQEIKDYGLDCMIKCIQITDVHAREWLSHNAAQVDASNIPCFIFTDSDAYVTAVIPIKLKKKVYDLVVSYYI